ncbi:glycosyltransferase family 4 protein [Massilia sp. BJB1822]|uniref:glycosyltransferase family 4 protein n=1 Tax=Massilia sp. BJB1822 TaxID=2744470 RepID=UPI00159438A7|nr:glycosyltransferase family 4 protein [Massilia sp. BJB1822]NVD99996.1 glycosyltransferase family 4 protein [Massilia sp. BJB1822]
MKKIVMIGTHFSTMGGISSVVNVYRQAGLFERLPVEYLATHCDGGGGAKLGIAARALARYLLLLLRGEVGLLHMHVSSRASFWRKLPFFFLAERLGIPTIVHLHSGEFHLFYGEQCGPRKQRLIRYVFDRASRVIVLSQKWQEWLQTISSNPHIHAIYNPVQLPPPAPARAPGQTVLVLGRLGKLKGSYDLVQALALLAPRFPALQLVMGGDGELEAGAARAAELEVAPQLKLLGWATGAAKEAALRGADVYALPSYNEGMPMSVLEAMAYGLPVVTTPVGGIPAAVSDGVEGFLVPPGDVAALADRLGQLLADPALAQRMGMAARRKIQDTFSTEAVLPRLQALYAELGFASAVPPAVTGRAA